MIQIKSVSIDKYCIEITEQTIKELNNAIKKARENDSKIKTIEVASDFSNVKFHIFLGQCESLGYI